MLPIDLSSSMPQMTTVDGRFYEPVKTTITASTRMQHGQVPQPANGTKYDMHLLPNPSEADLADLAFNAIFEAIKTWDINVPEYYSGYCGGNGSHAMLIVQALRKANILT